MGRNLQLCLATLIVLSSFPQANNQAVVFKSETCFHQDAPCSIKNVTCSDDERIVILDEQHAVSNGIATCTDMCALNCCQEGNFQCLHRVSGKSFSRTFSDCWNKTSCQYKPLQENRVFSNDTNCTSGSSQFGRLWYNCTKESSVRDFTDTTPAVGNLLVAVFSSSRTYPACVSPNSTLQCLVESEPGGAVALNIRVMLVVNHSTPGNCSKLHVTAGNYKSPDVPCSSYTEYIVIDSVCLEAQTYLVLQVNNEKDEAWAVVQSGQMLRMTCGKTCTSTPAEPLATPSSSSSHAASTSVSASTTASSPTSTEAASAASQGSPPNVSAIAGGVVGSIVVIFIVVVIGVIVIRRQRAPKPKAAAREPEQGLVVANSAYDDWDLDSGDGEGGTANGSSPSVLPPRPAPAQRPVTDVYAKVNKKSSRVTSPPSPDNTGLQPGHLPTCPQSGEVTDVYSRPKKGGKRQPDNGDNSDDVTSPEDSSSPPVIPPRRFRSSEATGNKMADNNAPEDHLAEYDHLGQKRRPTPQSGDVTYGHLGNKMAAEDPEASYDRLRGGDKRGAELPGPAVLSSHEYGRLGTEGASEEGDKGPYDRLGGTGRRDVIKDGVYHVASEVDTDPYSEHEPNFFEDE